MIVINIVQDQWLLLLTVVQIFNLTNDKLQLRFEHCMDLLKIPTDEFKCKHQ